MAIAGKKIDRWLGQGKEATTMRQAIFVVAMVAAAFLGGAVVNGPGLRWVQARLLDYMGLQDGGEIASIDLPQATSDPAEPHRRELLRRPASRTLKPSSGYRNRRSTETHWFSGDWSRPASIVDPVVLSDSATITLADGHSRARVSKPADPKDKYDRASPVRCLSLAADLCRRSRDPP